MEKMEHKTLLNIMYNPIDTPLFSSLFSLFQQQQHILFILYTLLLTDFGFFNDASVAKVC